MLEEGVEEHPQPPDGIPDISQERVRLLLGEEAEIEELSSFGSSSLVYPGELPEFSLGLLRAYLEHGEEIDGLINSYADRWSLQRMPLVDRNLLRLGIAELLYLPDVPPGVTVNEYVELAKVFSTEDSGKFVNGILGRVARGGRAWGKAFRLRKRKRGTGVEVMFEAAERPRSPALSRCMAGEATKRTAWSGIGPHWLVAPNAR
jgi:transcription antitermination factor NusB